MIVTFKLKTECLGDGYVKSRRQSTLGTENNSCKKHLLRDIGKLGLSEVDTNSKCLRSSKKASEKSGIRVRRITVAGSCRVWILF